MFRLTPPALRWEGGRLHERSATFQSPYRYKQREAATVTLIFAVPKLQRVVPEPERSYPAINQQFVVLSPIAIFCHFRTS